MVPICLFLLFSISLDSMAQLRRNRATANVANQNYGYCLSNIAISPEQQAKVDKLQLANQEQLAVLRAKAQATRDWTVKEAAWKEMDVLRASHQKEIWTVVPEAKNQAYINYSNRPVRQVAAGRGGGRGGAVRGGGMGYGSRGGGKGYGNRGGGFGRNRR